MFEELKNCENINILGYEKGPLAEYLGTPDEALALLKESHGVSLDPKFKASFHRFSRLGIHWRGASENSAVGGEFYLVHLLNAIIGGRPADLASSRSSEKEAALYSDFRIFDSQPRGGVGTFAALRLRDGTDEPEIWYFHMNHGSTRMEIDYQEYLNNLLLTRGAYYWQYLFTDTPADYYHSNEITSGLRRAIEFLSDVFPNNDYSDLRARLHDRLA
ncbi:hypothetical protein [Streptomyces griseus]|uniref:hypothetical protein n=1 Tax=Streptomyces griseus TaxID=1911 RepID=UPI00368B4ACA